MTTRSARKELDDTRPCPPVSGNIKLKYYEHAINFHLQNEPKVSRGMQIGGCIFY